MLHLLQKPQIKKIINKLKNLTPVEASAFLHVVGLISLIIMLGFSESSFKRNSDSNKELRFKFSVQVPKENDIVIEKNTKHIPNDIVIAKNNTKVKSVKDDSKPTSLIAKPPDKVIPKKKPTDLKKVPPPQNNKKVEANKSTVDNSKIDSKIKVEKKDINKVNVIDDSKGSEGAVSNEFLDKFLNELSNDDDKNKDFNYGYSSESDEEDSAELSMLKSHVKDCLSYYYDDSSDLYNNLIVKIKIITGEGHRLQSFRIVGANRKLEQADVSELLGGMKKAFSRENCRILPVSDNLLGMEKEFYITLDLSER